MFFVVPRANDLCFLGIIRSLQEKSKVVSLTYSWKGAKFLSDYSNCLINRFKSPNPAKEPYKFVKKLVEIGKFLKKINNQKSFYMPSSDTNMMVAIDNWNKLSNYYLILGNKKFTKPNKFVYSKIHTFNFLKKNNFGHIPTWRYNKKLASSLLKKKEYFVIKPNQKDYSQSFYKKNNRFKAALIKNKNDYQKFNKIKFDTKNLIIQKYIQIKKKEDELPVYAYVSKKGEIISSIGAVKEVIEPKNFGTAIALSLKDDSILKKKIKKIVKKLNWRGPIMIEFIYDKEDNEWKVLEFNGRPWLMIDFFRKVNLNFLNFLVKDINNQKLLKKKFDKKKLKRKKYLNIILSNYFKKFGQKKLLELIKNKKINLYSAFYDKNDIEPQNMEIKNIQINKKIIKKIK